MIGKMRIWRRVGRVFVGLLIGLLLLYLLVFGAAYVLLKVPAVQAQILPWAIEKAEKALDARIEVDKLELSLFDYITVEGFAMYDRQGVKALAAGELHLGIFSFPTLTWLFQPDGIKRIMARSIILNDGQLILYKDRELKRLNLSILFSPEPPPKDTSDFELPPLALDVGTIEINNFTFQYTDSTYSDSLIRPTTGHMNYRNMRLEAVDLVSHLSYRPDGTIEFILDELSAYESHAGLAIGNIRFDLTSRPASGDSLRAAVMLKNAELEVEGTFLNMDLEMPDQTLGTLLNEGQNRKFDAKLRASVFDWKTLNFFLSEPLPVQGPLSLEGRIYGDYRTLRSQDLVIRYGEYSQVRANARLRNYIEPDLMFAEIKLSETYLDTRDIEQVLPTLKLPEEVKRIGYARIDGRFTGFWHDFVAQATFDTRQGHVESDLNLKYDTLTTALTYSGKVKTKQFNVAALLNRRSAKSLNFEGEIKGRSVGLENTVAQTQFRIHQSEIYGYEIDSVFGELDINLKTIGGQITVVDREGSFAGDVEVDLNGPEGIYKATGLLKNFDLKHYGVSERPISLGTAFRVNARGNELDFIQGTAMLEGIYLRDEKTRDSLQLLDLQADLLIDSTGTKHLTFDGSSFLLTADGNFRYESIARRIEQTALGLLERYNPNYTAKDSLDRNAVMGIPLAFENLNLRFEVRDINPILAFMQVPVRVATQTTLSAFMDFDFTSRAQISLMSDSLRYNELVAREVIAGLNWDYPPQDSGLKVRAEVYATQFRPSESFIIENPAFTLNDDGEWINYDAYYEQTRLQNRVRLLGKARLDTTGIATQLDADKTFITLQDTVWRVETSPWIYWQNKSVRFDSLKIAHGPRNLTLFARISGKPEDLLVIDAEAFDLGMIGRFYPLKIDLEGRLDALIKVKDPLGKFVVEADAKVSDFRLEKRPLGDIYIKSRLQEGTEKLKLQVDWFLEKDTILVVNGYYLINDSDQPLFFSVQANRLPLALAKPFAGDLLTELEGYLYLNETQIRGSFSDPQIKGRGRLDGYFGLSFLGEYFIMDDEFQLNGQSLEINNMILRNYDPKTRKIAYDQKAVLSGKLTFLPSLTYTLQVSSIQNLRVINTDKKSEQPLYGQVVIGQGDARIVGDLNGMRITSSELRTGVGTVMSIPVSDYAERERLSYIHFVGKEGPTESRPTYTAGNRSSTGFDLEFELTTIVTPDAQVNIIFDEQIGDQIRVRGEGILNVSVSPDGDLSMSGQYNIIQGDYLFTFANVINRRFRISTGTLQWVDDPIDARIDLKAVYRLEQANLSAWDTLQSMSTKIDVVMNMTGSLLQPNITFGLEAPMVTQNQSFLIAQTLRQVENDPQELNRQVFSLIVTGAAAPVGQFLGNDAAGASASASMSEFLTNQLNNIIGRTINKNIGISLAYSDRVLVMNFKANLMNNRVTLERNGAIASGGTNRDITLGNLNIQYRILPNKRNENQGSGQLVAELFNRESIVTNALNSTTRGVGIFFRKEFDWIRKPQHTGPLILDNNPGY